MLSKVIIAASVATATQAISINKQHEKVSEFLERHPEAVEAFANEYPKLVDTVKDQYPKQIAAFIANPKKALTNFIRNHPNVIQNYFDQHKDEIKNFCRNRKACMAIKDFYMSAKGKALAQMSSKKHADIKAFAKKHQVSIKAFANRFPDFIEYVKNKYPVQTQQFLDNPTEALEWVIENHSPELETFKKTHKATIRSFCTATKENGEACKAVKDLYEEVQRNMSQSLAQVTQVDVRMNEKLIKNIKHWLCLQGYIHDIVHEDYPDRSGTQMPKRPCQTLPPFDSNILKGKNLLMLEHFANRFMTWYIDIDRHNWKH